MPNACDHCFCLESYLAVCGRYGCIITTPVVCCRCRADKPPGMPTRAHRAALAEGEHE